MDLTSLLPVLLSVPLAGALLSAFLPANARNAEAWLAGGVAMIGLLIVVSFYPQISAGTVVEFSVPWMTQFGLDFSLRMDGFAWMFALLITGIGVLVVIYARYYMSPEDPVPRFFSFLLAFMTSMLGVVLSGNLIQIVFFWELTSLFSFLLIGYWHHNAAAREGARTSLLVTGGGGLCLLGGVLILGHIVGSYELSAVLAAGDQIRAHPYYLAALILVLMGVFTKSAQFPFHFWLPHAMAAPTPVSSYLHSATMVKAGVFLLARLWPALAGTEAWFWLVTMTGLCTLLIGAWIAIFQQDVKGLLAYSTISHLGLITLLLGLNSPMAAVAGVFHIMNHATFKASLFMGAGIIDHESGTRDIRLLRGMRHLMPVTALLVMVASAAMAGVPLLNGFLSKEMFFAETVHMTEAFNAPVWLPLAATVGGAFSVAYSLRFVHGVFFGTPATDLPRQPHEPPRWMRFPIEFLVLVCLLVGILPALTVGPLLDVAAHGVLGEATPEFSLAVWHGFNRALLMSVIALIGGVALYMLLRNYLDSGIDGPPLTRSLQGKRFFDQFLVLLSWRVARPLSEWLGTRYLQSQLRAALIFTVVLVLMVLAGRAPALQPVGDFDYRFALLWLVGGIGAVACAWQAKYHRLAALALLGVAGLCTCLTFVWLAAPDLALTQLLVEIVTTVLILLGLRWLPKRIASPDERATWRDRLRRGRDLLLALASGGAMALIAWVMMTTAAPEAISSFFLKNAYSQGGGTNVVNVILVDFRGFDTFGEITVLGIVALTVYALLRRFRPAPESREQPRLQRLQAAEERECGLPSGIMHDANMTIASVTTGLLFPIIGAVALYLFLRGHNLPGGGFVAGLTLSIAFVLQYMTHGARWVEAQMRVNATLWITAGLFTALLTGMGAWLLGYPFLTSHTRYVAVPLLGDIPLATALFFDLGVFLAVVGTTLLILIALAHQSLRARHSTED